MSRRGEHAVAPLIVPPGFALTAPSRCQPLFALPQGHTIVREQNVWLENKRRGGMDEWPCLYRIVPIPFHADPCRRDRSRAVADHRPIRSRALNADEEDLVVGNPIFWKVEASCLVGELVHRELSLGQHVLPREPRSAEHTSELQSL